MPGTVVAFQARMSRFHHLVAGALTVTVPTLSQPAVFPDDSAVPILESEAADRAAPTRTTYRLRLQSVSPTTAGTRVYQRLEVRDEDGREAFFLVERDPGERSWNDFVAFYLRWSSPARPIEVVAGDLRPGFGQGLLFSRTSRNGTRDWRPSPDHRRLGYRSSGENEAFRGLGVRGRAGFLSWALVGGRGRRDARVDETGTVTSLPSSGIHVSNAERMGQNRLGLRVFGARLRCAVRGLSVGLVGQDIRFDQPLDLRRQGRKGAAFHGQRARRGSVDLLLKRQQLELATAVAVDGSSRMGTAIVLRLRLPHGRVAGGWRQHRAGFANPFGRTTSANNNETGAGGEWTGGNGRFKWRLALDQHRKPQAEYSSPLPSETLRWSGEVETRVGRQARFEVRMQTNERRRWSTAGRQRDHTRRLRLDLHLRGAKLRVEGRQNGGSNSDRGGLASVLWRHRWRHLRGAVHLSRFRTDAYAARIYEYEYDLPGSYSIRPLYGNGWRIYVRTGFTWRGLQLMLRYRLQSGDPVRHHLGLQVDLAR